MGADQEVRAVGVDIGGTFTDAVLLLRDGRTVIGKALTTPADPTAGALAAVTVAAANLGRDLPSVLGDAEWLAHGTTVGLNAILTDSGATVGLLTTEGFEATLPIAKINTILGLDELEQTEAVHWEKPPMLVPRSRIRGVPERIDTRGTVVRPLDEDAARTAIRQLGDQGVNSIAICLLWSTVNPLHEHELARLVAEELPGVHVSCGSTLTNRIGEYERTVTAVFNAAIAPLVVEYLNRFESELRHHGFRGQLLTMSTDGGTETAQRAREYPIHTLNSGPIGGLAAARDMGRGRRDPNIICTDVGGTSFDVGLIIGGEMQYTRSARIRRHALSIPVVEISSIGTGGGSVAWVDPATGALRVGPRSAGADPGPICYGRGGQLPTVTDAACVLGYIERVGEIAQLQREKAAGVIERTLAGPLHLSVTQAAEGILDVASSQMADLIRRMTVLRGRDPSDFRLYAYGGAAPQYCGKYAADLGVADVLIPQTASVFSAFGAATSEILVRIEEEAGNLQPERDFEELTTRLKALRASAFEVLGGSEADHAGCHVSAKAGIRFQRQVHEYVVGLATEVFDPVSARALDQQFRRDYEQVVGKGSAYLGAGIEVVSLCVEVRVPLSEPGTEAVGAEVVATHPPVTGERDAWIDGAWRACPVHDGQFLRHGVEVDGPAFVELPTTTVVVYPGQRLTATSDGDMLLRLS